MRNINKGLAFYKIFFVSIAVLFGANVLPKALKATPGNIAMVKERAMEAQRAGIQRESLANIENKNAPDLYTQSQAHLQLKSVRTLIKDKFNDKVVPYFDVISRMITKEAKLKNSHYVFYHAAASITAVQSDLFTQLYFYEHPEAKKSDDEFRFLRFQEESKNMTVQEFVAKEMRTSGLIDDSGALGAILLSVNLALFGNVGSATECTWHWFFNSRSVPKPDIFETMMKTFGLSNKYIKEIMALNDIIEMPEGSILQVCIPKHMVDELVYLAWIRGVPATGPIMDWVKEYQSSKNIPRRDRGSLEHTKQSRETLAEIFKKEQDRNPIFRDFMKNLEAGDFSTYAFLRAYCNKPKELPLLNDTAGRILFTKQGLLNPASNIKFYRYLTTPREKIEQYTKKLNEIVQKLIAEKEGKTTPIVPQPKPNVIPVPVNRPVVPVSMPQPRPNINPAPVSKPVLPVTSPKAGRPILRPTKPITR